jgi:predicted protein tyrosine phosphatase
MSEPDLVILGYSEAGMYLRGRRCSQVKAVLSIHGRREFGVEAPDVGARLDLVFDDVEVPAVNDVMAMQRAMARRGWAEQNGLVEVPPIQADAEAIVTFARAVRDVGGILLCHCGAGMSRAPAAALICLAVWRGPGCEAECMTEVLRLRRGAVPHVGLVRFADELLGRGGALVASLAGATH